VASDLIQHRLHFSSVFFVILSSSVSLDDVLLFRFTPPSLFGLRDLFLTVTAPRSMQGTLTPPRRISSEPPPSSSVPFERRWCFLLAPIPYNFHPNPPFSAKSPLRAHFPCEDSPEYKRFQPRLPFPFSSEPFWLSNLEYPTPLIPFSLLFQTLPPDPLQKTAPPRASPPPCNRPSIVPILLFQFTLRPIKFWSDRATLPLFYMAFCDT